MSRHYDDDDIVAWRAGISATRDGRSTAPEIAAARLRRPTWRCSNSQTEPICGAHGAMATIAGIVRLRQQHDPPVVAEVHVAQLGVAIEAEALPHQRVEVPGQEVGEEEGAGLFVVHRGERLGAGEELVAVRAGQALDSRMVSEQRSRAPPVPQSA